MGAGPVEAGGKADAVSAGLRLNPLGNLETPRRPTAAQDVKSRDLPSARNYLICHLPCQSRANVVRGGGYTAAPPAGG